MNEPSRTLQVRLAALAANLAPKLDVNMTDRGLVVHNPQVAGCCEEQPTAGDTITCRPRPENAGAAWFRTSWGEWIAPADRLTDAATAVLSYLGCRPEKTGKGR